MNGADDEELWLDSLDAVLAEEWLSDEDCAAYDGLGLSGNDGAMPEMNGGPPIRD